MATLTTLFDTVINTIDTTVKTVDTVVVKSGSVIELTLSAAESGAHIVNNTARVTRMANGIWAMDKLQGTSDEHLALLESFDPTLDVPSITKS